MMLYLLDHLLLMGKKKQIKDIMDEFAPGKCLLMNNGNFAIRLATYVVVIVLIMLTGVFDAGQFIYANF